jgi:hypothetical protein
MNTNLICSSSVDTLIDDAKQRTITVQINFKHCSRINNHRFIFIDFGNVEKRRWNINARKRSVVSLIYKINKIINIL